MPISIAKSKGSSFSFNENHTQTTDNKVGADNGSVAIGAGGSFDASDNSVFTDQSDNSIFYDKSDRSVFNDNSDRSFTDNSQFTDSRTFEDNRSYYTTDHGAVNAAINGIASVQSRTADLIEGTTNSVLAANLEAYDLANEAMADERARAYGLAGTALDNNSNTVDQVIGVLGFLSENAQEEAEAARGFALDFANDLYDANRTADEAISQNIVSGVKVVAVVGLIAFAAVKFKK